METYTFQDIIAALQTGREIEFRFQNNSYGIVNQEGYWYFCCTEQKKSIKLSPFDNIPELVHQISDESIIGLNLKDIFNLSKYEKDSLYIL